MWRGCLSEPATPFVPVPHPPPNVGPPAAFNLEFYTQVQDLSYLVRSMGEDPFTARFRCGGAGQSGAGQGWAGRGGELHLFDLGRGRAPAREWTREWRGGLSGRGTIGWYS